jgi:hypothetical protein
MEIDNKVFRNPHLILLPALLGIVMNYIVLVLAAGKSVPKMAGVVLQG